MVDFSSIRSLTTITAQPFVFFANYSFLSSGFHAMNTTSFSTRTELGIRPFLKEKVTVIFVNTNEHENLAS